MYNKLLVNDHRCTQGQPENIMLPAPF